ncbi:Protein STB5 [Fusarium austroafricanum]|uniref:Protein STB5 n=1 Tax=Fusarium austroafricanum TaxID=2364996 RepID=A0A8H4KM60_9HYPO|nr:Protein STB5 [Fusarium austroafricanum]
MSNDPAATPSPTHRIFACERCFRRKQRCDKALPNCAQCLESGSTCKDSDREARIVQVDGNIVARKGYVTTLLERLEALQKEASLRGLNIEDSALHAGVRSPPQDRRASSPQTAQTLPMGWSLSGHGVDMDTLSLSAMAEPRSRAGEFLKQLSMPRIIAGVTETYGGNPEATSRVDSLWDGISQYIRHPGGQSRRLHVPIGEANKALEAYLEVVDFRFPRLPVAKVRSGIMAIAADNDEAYQDKLSNNPSHIFMAYIVIAIVPLISDSYPISQGSFVSIHVLAKCLKVLDRVFNQEDGVDIIQCLHLLVVFSIHCSAAGSAWHLIGFAMNKCIALGYHREDVVPAQGQPDKDAQQQRRWAFWGCYLLDRLICTALGRPFSVHNRDVTVALPDEVNDISGPIEHCHAYLFRYAVLLSDLTNEKSSRTFHDQLGHLLYWQTCARTINDPSVDRASAYRTSLYHTLMLRIAVRHILSAYDFDGLRGHCHILAESGGPMDAGEARRVEHIRIKELSLLNICKAVSGSLERPGMRGRNFLSMITGYTAFLMALGVLYCKATQIDNSGESNNDDWHSLIQTASDTLTITGRQFPRMGEYRNIVEQVRKAIDSILASAHQNVDLTQLETVERSVKLIGPRQLQHLARAVVYLIRS